MLAGGLSGSGADGGDDAEQPQGGSSSGFPYGGSSGSYGAGSSGVVPGGGSSGVGYPGGSSSGSPGSGCGPDIRQYGASSSLACWGCIANGCPMQLAACAGDCSCNASVAQAIACIDGGGDILSCFMSALAGTTDSATNAFTSCLVSAGRDCRCSTLPGGVPQPDASPACVETGSGGQSGSAGCSSTLQEVCGSASYQVVCSCPRGTCVCFGDATTVISFQGCPYCPGGGITAPGSPTDADMFAACGFPTPQ